MKNKKTKHLIFAVAGLLALIGIFSLSGNSDELPYRTEKVTRGSIAAIVTANGTLNPIEIANVGTQVSGQVNSVYVKVNDEVKKGQLLAEIDPALLEAQIKQSRASLETARVAFEQAERDLKRTRMLVAKDFVAKVELERAEQSFLSARNSYESTKSSVEKDEVNLSYTKITSPIDGVVISQEITQGQTVAANFQTPNMFKIAGDLTQMKIDVSLPESDISKVKTDMPVTFTVDAFPERTFNGKVQTVNLNPNNQSGVVTYTVVVVVENPDKVLFPGMTAYVSITLSEVKDVLRVPAAALRFAPQTQQVSGLRRLFTGSFRGPRRNFSDNEEKQTVYVLKDDALTPVEVKPGATDETFVEVSGNIKEGDVVVTGLLPSAKR